MISAWDKLIFPELTTEIATPVFERVRSNFFPRFPKGWTVVVTEETDPEYDGEQPLGCCDCEKKEIRIQPKAPWEIQKIMGCRSSFKTHFLALLIHEMCHAIAPDGHFKKWQNRMKEAADRAFDLGYDDQSVYCLPRVLFLETKRYQEMIDERHAEQEGIWKLPIFPAAEGIV